MYTVHIVTHIYICNKIYACNIVLVNPDSLGLIVDWLVVLIQNQSFSIIYAICNA